MNFFSIGRAILLLFPTHLFAASMERSDQSIDAFLENDHYIEMSIAKVDAKVSGQIPQHEELKQLQVNDYSINNSVKSFFYSNIALKFQLNPQYSIGLIYDHPFGTDVSYDYKPDSLLGKQTLESASIKFKSQNLTLLTGFQPNPSWNIYAGLSHQSIEGDLKLDGLSYSFLSGYSAKIEEDTAVGWLAGVSYQIPEIALKTSITYRSAIEHNTQINETLSSQPLAFTPNSRTKIQTPQSVNLDLKIALNQNNLAYSTIRWVNWQNYKIQPTQFSAIIRTAAMQYPDLIQEFNLIDYQKNQISGKFGIAHRLTDRWVSTSHISWDSGSGNPASTLNSSDGFWGVGLGILYNLKARSYIACGLSYLRFNPAETVQSQTNVLANQIRPTAEAQHNSAIAYGLRIAHHF